MKADKGSILIIVLWMIVLSLSMISILANNTRLATTIVMHQQSALDDWAEILATIDKAKMELLVEKLNSSRSLAILLQNASGAKKAPTQYPFQGQEIKLTFPQADHIGVRINDLSGKINLSQLKRKKFKLLLEKQLGSQGSEIENLLDAWEDWTDRDDLKRLNGAEKNYYKSKKYSYEPRNGPLESVNELRLIKGFDEAFKGIDLTDVFTLYARSRQINPNIASKQTLLMIPGVTEELADEVIKQRNIQAFATMAEFKALFPPASVNQVTAWVGLSKSRYFSIVIYNKNHLSNHSGPNSKNIGEEPESQLKYSEVYVYEEIVQYLSDKAKPKTVRVFPSKKISLQIMPDVKNPSDF